MAVLIADLVRDANDAPDDDASIGSQLREEVDVAPEVEGG